MPEGPSIILLKEEVQQFTGKKIIEVSGNTKVDKERLLDQKLVAFKSWEKLGCVLFQLPPQIQYSEEKLEHIIGCLNTGFKNVIEFRHKSWWTKKVYDRLTKNKISFCSVSHPVCLLQLSQIHLLYMYAYMGYLKCFTQIIAKKTSTNYKRLFLKSQK